MLVAVEEKKKLNMKKFTMRQMVLYVATDKPYPLFLNDMYCLMRLGPCSVFEKLEIVMDKFEKCVVVLVTAEMFRIFVKGYETIKLFHNKNLYEINNYIKIDEATKKFSVVHNNEEILRDENIGPEKSGVTNKSSFAYINIMNACMNEKNTSTVLMELLRVKKIIERFLQFYNCEIASTDLEYVIVKFEDPLKLIHFVNKLVSVLDSFYLNTQGISEKLMYSIGISYGMFEKLHDYSSSTNYSYAGIALNMCARLAKLGANRVYLCKAFHNLVGDSLKYLNYSSVCIGEESLKGFERQVVYALCNNVNVDLLN